MTALPLLREGKLRLKVTELGPQTRVLTLAQHSGWVCQRGMTPQGPSLAFSHQVLLLGQHWPQEGKGDRYRPERKARPLGEV